jgi:hypothetical protein
MLCYDPFSRISSRFSYFKKPISKQDTLDTLGTDWANPNHFRRFGEICAIGSIMINPVRYFITVYARGPALSSGLIHDVVIDIEIDIPHKL